MLRQGDSTLQRFYSCQAPAWVDLTGGKPDEVVETGRPQCKSSEQATASMIR